MTQFESDPHLEPYSSFRFRVKWDGHYVQGVSFVSALNWIADVVEVREGTDPNAIRKLPGPVKFSPIILKRGYTQDPAFEAWANEVRGAGQSSAITPYHKDVVIDVFDDADRKVLSYKVHRCWVSEYQALPDLDACGNAIVVEQLKLENEGWERDTSVVPPADLGIHHRRPHERRKR